MAALPEGYAFSLSALTSARISGVQRACSFLRSVSHSARSSCRRLACSAFFSSSGVGSGGFGGGGGSVTAAGGGAGGGGGGGAGGGGGSEPHAATRQSSKAERRKCRVIAAPYSFVRPATNDTLVCAQNAAQERVAGWRYVGRRRAFPAASKNARLAAHFV